VDISLHIEHRLTPPPASVPTVDLRIGHLSDRDALVALTSGAVTTSRFVHDDRFPTERVEALYARWIERDLEGFEGTIVVVAERDGAPVGYYGWRPEGVDAARTSLCVVASTERRSGVFRSIIDEMVRQLGREGVQTLRATVHATNVASLRAHQRAGFLLAEVKATWHRWSDKPT
jgi:L-amino acid N-acyltransferase YncA